jgi:hypothetical protein
LFKAYRQSHRHAAEEGRGVCEREKETVVCICTITMSVRNF